MLRNWYVDERPPRRRYSTRPRKAFPLKRNARLFILVGDSCWPLSARHDKDAVVCSTRVLRALPSRDPNQERSTSSPKQMQSQLCRSSIGKSKSAHRARPRMLSGDLMLNFKGKSWVKLRADLNLLHVLSIQMASHQAKP